MSFEERIRLDGCMNSELARAAVLGENQATGEEQLVERLRAGEAAAFNHLVQERSGEIYALLCRLTEDREEAQDLTQETFLQAFRSISRFRGDANLRTWLYRIAVNQARNRHRWWRRRCRDLTVSLDAMLSNAREAPLGLGLQQPCANPEQQLLVREQDERLMTALHELQGCYREVIVLRDVEGLSYEEVAQALELSVGTVKSRLSRGRAELRRRFENSVC